MFSPPRCIAGLRVSRIRMNRAAAKQELVFFTLHESTLPTMTMMVFGFIETGLGSLIDHFLSSRRERRDNYRTLESVLLQIYELEEDDFRQAGQAARQASENGLDNTAVSHPGARVWQLRERMREAVDPVYPELSNKCKDGIDQADEWIQKLNDGGVVAHAQVTWVCGGAGEALNELPKLTIRGKVNRWLGRETRYLESMDIKMGKQVEVKAGLETRREMREDTGHHLEEENELEEAEK